MYARVDEAIGQLLNDAELRAACLITADKNLRRALDRRVRAGRSSLPYRGCTHESSAGSTDSAPPSGRYTFLERCTSSTPPGASVGPLQPSCRGFRSPMGS